MVDFHTLAQAIPELQSLNDRIEVVIVGYDSCPYSKKALRASKNHPRWKESGRVLFISYEFGATGALKSATGYRGSFPLVYVKQEGKFQYVGGGDAFEEYVEQKIAPLEQKKYSKIL